MAQGVGLSQHESPNRAASDRGNDLQTAKAARIEPVSEKEVGIRIEEVVIFLCSFCPSIFRALMFRAERQRGPGRRVTCHPKSQFGAGPSESFDNKRIMFHPSAETMLESLFKGPIYMIAKVKLHYEPDVRKIPATDVNEEESFLIIRNGEKIVGRFPLSQIEHWSLDQDPDVR